MSAETLVEVMVMKDCLLAKRGRAFFLSSVARQLIQRGYAKEIKCHGSYHKTKCSQDAQRFQLILERWRQRPSFNVSTGV